MIPVRTLTCIIRLWSVQCMAASYYLLVLSRAISLFLVSRLFWISVETHYIALWTILTALGPCLNALLSVLRLETSFTQPKDKIWIATTRRRSSAKKGVPVLRLWLTAWENLLLQTSLPLEAWQNQEEEISISWESNHYFPACCHS